MKQPSRIGPYDIAEVLGEGAMGTVYVAHQKEPVQRTVALKVLKETDDPAEMLHRYNTERQALAVMDHPSIARVFDAGITEGGAPYVVMELVPGTSILRFCDEHRLTIRQRLLLFSKVCRAVQHAHQKGVIHQDLKPEHILVSEVDGQPLPKIIDFGIATAVDREIFVQSRSESRDNVIGTPAYMSPEQIDGLSDVDTRSDIYSLGIILYELLVGVAPFEVPAKSAWGAVAARVMTDPPTPTDRFLSLDDTQDTLANLRRTTPGQLRKALHDDVDWIVKRAMAKDRAQRYATAHELALEIERHLALHPVHAHPPSLIYNGRKFVRRHRVAVGLGSVLAVSLALFTVTTSIQSAQVAEAHRQADARRAQAEGLIEFMLSDLRDQLEPLGRLDILDGVGDRAVDYFASVPPDGFTDEELGSLSRAMYQIGDVRMDQGRLPEAGRAFEESLELAKALSARAPDNPDRLYTLGQAEFYAGNRYYVEHRFDEAMTHFSAYRDISDELARRDPENLTYQLEVGYSHTNVGTVHHARGELDAALEEFTRSLDAKRLVAEPDPENARRRFDIGQGHNLLGALLTDMGRLDEAQAHFEADVAIKADLVQESPGNATFTYRLVVAYHRLAGIYHDRGDVSAALGQYRAQRDLLEPLVENDPSNLRWARNLSAAEAREAHARADVGGLAEADRLVTSSVLRMQRVVGQNPDQPGWRADLAMAHRARGGVLLKAGRLDEAERAAVAAVTEATALHGEAPNEPAYTVALALAEVLTGEVLRAAGRREEAAAMYEATLDRLQPLASESTDAEVLLAFATALVGLDRPDEARTVLSSLEAMGYAAPEFVAFREAVGMRAP